MEPKRPLKVFLCHAHADRDPVRGLYARLTQDGVDAWLDKEKLLPGQDWELEIRKAVREADVVVVCLSKQFNQAGFRQKEVRLALDTAMEKPEGEIFIIPARLEECDNLESLRKWHWVDLFETDGYEMLMRALRVRANKIGATLQLKKSWLPKITSPNMNFEKPVEKKKLVVSTPDESESKTGDGKVEQKVTEDKEKREAAEKVEGEKKQRELKRALKKVDQEYKRQIRKIEWQHRWESFVGEIRYRLKLLRIYRAPILILLVTFGLVVPLLIRLSNLIPKITSEFNNTPTATIGLSITPQQNLASTQSFVPANSFTPSSMSSETIAPTSLPTKIVDAKDISMELVPAGEFIMGSNTGQADERLAHKVYLDSFYLDVYEVTNAFYKVCVDTGECNSPKNNFSYTRTEYYGNPKYENYPVLYVDWNMAKNFCEWRDARLPTEAEWEKAARGTNASTYPWGTTTNFDQCFYSNIGDCVGDTTMVGKYDNGKSVYGIYDLSGNVWEWVSDFYNQNYYQTLSGNVVNPKGPVEGDIRVLRGDAWNSNEESGTSANRYWDKPSVTNYFIGFRCARDANP